MFRAGGLSQIDAFIKAGYGRGKEKKELYKRASEFENGEIRKEIGRLQAAMQNKIFDLRSACAKLAPAAVDRLEMLLSDPLAFANLGAISQILDRAYGKPKEEVHETITVVWDI